MDKQASGWVAGVGWSFGVVGVVGACVWPWVGGGSADAQAHAFGVWSLWPPIVAVVVAMFTRRVVPALLIGIFVGAILLEQGRIHVAAYETIESHVWGQLAGDADHLRVIAFTLLMGAMVGVISRSGGMRGLVNLLLPLARGRRGAQVVGWFIGLLIFFDDYANTVVLGHTMRPLTDRLRVSRAKLAYLVDSTAAPVAGLSIVSTWVAVEISYIQDAVNAVGAVNESGFSLFVRSIPFRFYVLLSLVMVPLVGLMGRDFGPMLRAERRAASGENVKGRWVARGKPQAESLTPPESTPARALNAIVPVLLVVLLFFIAMWLTGRAQGEGLPTSLAFLGEGDPYLALFYGALVGAVAAALMGLTQGLFDGRQMLSAVYAGMRMVMPAVVVLVVAWGLAGVVGGDQLDAGGYLAGLIQPPPDGASATTVALLPALVFIIAAGMSFSTGTSWGTMAVLMPIAVQVVAQLIGSEPGAADVPFDTDRTVVIATIGSVLSGAIFGDHCSPISDTTVLSSQSAGCDHIEHVTTQMPYALLVGGLSVVGLIAVGFGVSAWVVLVASIAVMVGVLRTVGRSVEGDDSSTPS